MLYMRSVVSLINLKIYIGREMGIRLGILAPIYDYLLITGSEKETNIRFKTIYIRYSYDSMVFLKF